MTEFNPTLLKVLFGSIPFGSLVGCYLAGSARSASERTSFIGTWIATVLLAAIFLYYIMGFLVFLSPLTLWLLYVCLVLLFVGAVQLRHRTTKQTP